MVPLYIALGSNVGERLSHLQEAIDRLNDKITIQAASAVYETAPMYVVNQPAFLNAAIRAETDLPPLALLALLKKTEKEVGRQDRQRYGPREVDLDLIAYGSLRYRYVVAGQTLLDVPHSKIKERRFVLQPLFDLNPNLSLPTAGHVCLLLDATKEQEKDIVRRNDAVLSV